MCWRQVSSYSRSQTREQAQWTGTSYATLETQKTVKLLQNASNFLFDCYKKWIENVNYVWRTKFTALNIRFAKAKCAAFFFTYAVPYVMHYFKMFYFTSAQTMISTDVASLFSTHICSMHKEKTLAYLIFHIVRYSSPWSIGFLALWFCKWYLLLEVVVDVCLVDSIVCLADLGSYLEEI